MPVASYALLLLLLLPMVHGAAVFDFLLLLLLPELPYKNEVHAQKTSFD
jgi:hypothetical protein